MKHTFIRNKYLCFLNYLDIWRLINKMKLTSVFNNNEMIPSKYTCDGENVNPELVIENVPQNTVSLALIVHDPDAPMPGGFTHWVAWNLSPNLEKIEEDSFPNKGLQGENGAKTKQYIGSCPPSGTHRYFFTIYALNTFLRKEPAFNKEELEKEIQGSILEKAELIGLYSRNK
jgi:Raf kinase inhibitor-like YbhB/YbcL family protein